MITRKVGLDWIEARLNYIRKITTERELNSMKQVFELDLHYLLHEHALISLAEHEILTRRALAEIAFRREKLGKVLRFPIMPTGAAYVLRGEV
tara:strand:- start:12901 stop:13179 length:279 start_codon:yes stop_codon:yes gene_type:complete